VYTEEVPEASALDVSSLSFVPASPGILSMRALNAA